MLRSHRRLFRGNDDSSEELGHACASPVFGDCERGIEIDLA